MCQFHVISCFMFFSAVCCETCHGTCWAISGAIRLRFSLLVSIFNSKCLGTAAAIAAIANIRWFSGAGSRSEATAGLPQVTKAAQQGLGVHLIQLCEICMFLKAIRDVDILYMKHVETCWNHWEMLSFWNHLNTVFHVSLFVGFCPRGAPRHRVFVEVIWTCQRCLPLQAMWSEDAPVDGWQRSHYRVSAKISKVVQDFAGPSTVCWRYLCDIWLEHSWT